MWETSVAEKHVMAVGDGPRTSVGIELDWEWRGLGYNLSATSNCAVA